MHTVTIETMDTRRGTMYFAYCGICKASTGCCKSEAEARRTLRGPCKPVKRNA